MKEYKGIVKGSVIVSENNLMIKSAFIQESCTFNDILSVDLIDPNMGSNGYIKIRTNEFNETPHQIFFRNKNKSEFAELYSILSSREILPSNTESAEIGVMTNVENELKEVTPPVVSPIAEMTKPQFSVAHESKPRKPKKIKNAMQCKNCNGHNIQILQSGINMKSQIVDNINPLQPFTSKKIRQRKKISGLKATAAIMTGGLSGLVFGIRREKQYEVFCTDCGNRWKSK